MNELVLVKDGNAYATSKEISDHFNVKGGHRYILSVIRSIMAEQPKFGEQEYLLSSYTSIQNKVLPCYLMSRDGFTLLAMGLNGSEATKWKIKYMKAFNSMESALSKTPVTMDQLNDLVARIEGNKEAASIAGKALNSYKKIKQQDASDFKLAVDQAQLALKI